MYDRWSEKAMAPHSSTLAWKIPWMEEPGRLQSMGSQRVGHNWATSLSLFTFMHWRRKWQPTPVFLPGEFQPWWAAIYGVAQSWTRLRWLSSSSNSSMIGCWRGAEFATPKCASLKRILLSCLFLRNTKHRRRGKVMFLQEKSYIYKGNLHCEVSPFLWENKAQ